jgi:putative ABC transport system permease protein
MEAVLIGILGASLGLAAGIGMGYMLVSSSPGGEESEENGNATDSAGSGSPGDDTEASTQETQETQQAETFVPVFLGEDMLRVWVISVGLSMIAGFYPAWKASRYLPVDTLRSSLER